MEILSQLDVACDLGYISQEEFDEIEVLIKEEEKMILGMIRKRRAAGGL